ncbi:MAG TPA: helix-turn-helix domain-containing protein [Steroidobacteraceae bacterium]|nr:helix-turn-helix domain-containing protein [Steroidobacteraceae bacterium]
MHPITHATQVGASLSARRKSLKLSQKDVASRLGLSQNRLSELETRPQSMTLEQLIALLNILGLEMRIDERATTKSRIEW